MEKASLQITFEAINQMASKDIDSPVNIMLMSVISVCMQQSMTDKKIEFVKFIQSINSVCRDALIDLKSCDDKIIKSAVELQLSVTEKHISSANYCLDKRHFLLFEAVVLQSYVFALQHFSIYPSKYLMFARSVKWFFQ